MARKITRSTLNEEDRCGVLASVRMPRPYPARKRRNASAARTGTGRGRRRGRWRPISVAQARRRGWGREVRRCAKQAWRHEPQGTTGVSAMLRCNVRAEHQGQLGHHPAWSHTWDIRNAHTPLECAHPTVRLACVCAHVCTAVHAVCSRSCVVRERQSDGGRGGREGTRDRGRLCGSARSGSGHGRCERGRNACVGCKNTRSSGTHTR
jgi:hypothetical protein